MLFWTLEREREVRTLRCISEVETSGAVVLD